MPSLSNIETINASNINVNEIDCTLLEAETIIATNQIDATTVETYNLDVDNGLLYTDQTNNRVGVNTSAPSASLDVRDSTSGDHDIVKLYSTSLSDTAANKLNFGYNGNEWNSAYMRFNKVSSGSQSNYLDFGFAGHNAPFTMTGYGEFTLGGNVTITGIINLATYLRTTYGSTLPTHTSVDVGFSYSQNGGTTGTFTSGAVPTNVGGTVYTLSPGIYSLSGHVQINATSSGPTITSIVYGFSSDSSSFTNTGTGITNFRITRDTGTRLTSFGNFETYPGLNTSQTLKVTANTNIYFLAQLYFSGVGNLVSSNSNWNFVRIA